MCNYTYVNNKNNYSVLLLILLLFIILCLYIYKIHKYTLILNSLLMSFLSLL